MKLFSLSLFFLSLMFANLLVATPVTLSSSPKTTSDLSIDFVEIGDPANPEDPANHRGSVAEKFRLSKYDFTAAQYCIFLNKVARFSDPYQLYDERMSSDANVASIIRTGNQTSGYTYKIKSPETAQLPITYVSWFSSARCCNWLDNSERAGKLLEGTEDASTTEKGAYDFTVPIKVVTSRYIDFLNAVATKEDLNHLHKNLYQDEKRILDIISCVKGDDGKYAYSLKKSEQSEASVVVPSHIEVSWASAARFSNWKYNTETTKNPRHYSQEEITERGLFTIAEGIKDMTGDADVVPTNYAKVSPDAKYFLATENQWYKAAYFKRKKYGNGYSAEYYKYPTSKDVVPGNHSVTQKAYSRFADDPLDQAEIVTNGSNLANYYIDGNLEDQKFTTGNKLPHLTPVGYFVDTKSPYGLFDMAGNVSEWLSGTPGHYVTFSYDDEGHITKSDLAKLDNTGQPLLNERVTAEKEELYPDGHVMKKDAEGHILLQWQYAGVTRPIPGGCWGKEGQCPVGPDQFEKATVTVIDASVKRDYIGFRIAAPSK